MERTIFGAKPLGFLGDRHRDLSQSSIAARTAGCSNSRTRYVSHRGRTHRLSVDLYDFAWCCDTFDPIAATGAPSFLDTTTSASGGDESQPSALGEILVGLANVIRDYQQWQRTFAAAYGIAPAGFGPVDGSAHTGDRSPGVATRQRRHCSTPERRLSKPTSFRLRQRTLYCLILAGFPTGMEETSWAQLIESR